MKYSAVPQGYYVSYNQHSTGTYRASNAFGASVTVKQFNGSGVGIAGLKRRYPDEWPSPYAEVTLNMTAEEARRELPGARLTLRGFLEAYELGRVTVCGTESSEATISLPVAMSDAVCLFNGRVTSITVRGASGKILQVWEDPAFAAHQTEPMELSPAP